MKSENKIIVCCIFKATYYDGINVPQELTLNKKCKNKRTLHSNTFH